MKWEKVKLGGVIASAQSGFASGVKDENGIIQVRMNNVDKNGNLNLTEVRRVPKTQTNLEKYYIRPNDVLFNSTNSPNLVGKSALFLGHQENIVFSNHFLRLRSTPQLLPTFLSHWLVYKFQQRIFEGLCTQWVNQASVRKEDLLSLEIPLPPLAEQERIAARLDAADQLRTWRRDALARLDALTHSLFLDMFGDPESNPKGWEIVQLGDVCTEVYRYPTYYDITYEESGVPEVRGELIKADGTLEKNKSKYRYISSQTSSRFPKTILSEGDLVMSVRGTIGKIAIVKKDLVGANITANLIKIALDKTRGLPQFILFLMRGNHFKSLLQQASASTTIQTIKAPSLKSCKIPLPPLSLQKEFVEKMEQIEVMRVRMEASRVELDGLFASLQNEAFG